MAFPVSLASLPNILGSSLVMDAANEENVFIFRATRTGNIRKAHFLLHTVSSAPSSNHSVRIETVDASTGLSTGTLVATDTSGSQLLDTVGWKTITLTADAAVTLGTAYALVVKAPSSNFGNVGLGSFPDQNGDFPYCTVAGAKSASTVSGLFAIEYDDGTLEAIPGVWPISAINSRTYNNTGTNHRALRFKWPAPTRLIGCVLWIDADGDFDVVFYDSDGASATTLLSVDKDLRAGATPMVQFLRFTTTKSITKDTFYRIAIVPTSSTNVVIYDFDVASAAVLNAVPGGANFHLSTADGTPANDAAWTQTLTNRPFIAPIFDQVDDGVSVSPVIAGTPMRRGMV